jgi:hypothetical protein
MFFKKKKGYYCYSAPEECENLESYYSFVPLSSKKLSANKRTPKCVFDIPSVEML